MEPSLHLATPVLHIGGLANYKRPQPKLVRSDPEWLWKNGPKYGSGPSGNYMGNDFRAAYLPGVTLIGTGQAVGLLELDGYWTSDIAQYESLAGLPNVPLTNILIDSFNGQPGTNNSEVALDIEMAIAMAPGLSKVLVYEVAGDTTAEMNDLLNRMVTDNAAKQLSCSWDFPMDATSDQILKEMAVQGQCLLNASGDNGAYVGPIPTPDDDPYIVQVGGTTLTTSGAGGSWVSETTWNWGGGTSSGGGISTDYAIPSWQQGTDMTPSQGSTTHRNVPDVALTADNVFIVADNGQQEPGIGGTSCAAPLWAGFLALVNEQATTHGKPIVGFINPAIYAIGENLHLYTNSFHDITYGDNTWSGSPTVFYATRGYDLCTGWGTPSGISLIDLLAGVTTNVQYTIVASAGSGGTISPTGTFSKNAGDNQTFTANPNVNYAVNQWILDGTNVQSGGTNYTSYNIQTNHSIQVTFKNAPDTTPPTVVISYPTNRQIFSVNAVTAGGTATDNVTVAAVQVSINNGAWQAANNDRNGWQMWSAGVSLSAGNNTIAARAMDVAGNFSSIASVTVVYDPTLTTNYTIVTLAGTTNSGNSNGTGSAARFSLPHGVAADPVGNVYVADPGNYTIRKVTIAGVVTTLAGQPGSQGTNDGPGSTALFELPLAVALDPISGSIYVVDRTASTVRRLTLVGTNWIVATIAGSPNVYGTNDGIGGSALLQEPEGLTVGANGVVFVADSLSSTIRQITPSGTNWVVTTIAGAPTKSGVADGTNGAARFDNPQGIATDLAGNLYVADTGNATIRRIARSGANWVVTMIAGSPGNAGFADGPGLTARFDFPTSVTVDTSGSLYVADVNNYAIRKIMLVGTNWMVSTIAGSPASRGSADGTGSLAQFTFPSGVAGDNMGNIYVADGNNHEIRKGWPSGTLPVIVFNSPVLLSNNQFQFSFVVTTGSVASFVLLEAGEWGGIWSTNASPSTTTNVVGVSYTLSVPDKATLQFFRIQSQ